MAAVDLRAASAAMQGDGGIESDWTRWEQEVAPDLARHAATTNYGQGKLRDVPATAFDPENYISGLAVDHFHRYEEDLDLARELGLTSYRFSVSWACVEPHPGQTDWNVVRHYREVALACRKRSINPVPAFWHFELPIWAELLGGWESAEVRRRFVGFCLLMAIELYQVGVREVATLNEPDTYTMCVYARWLPTTKWLSYPQGWRRFWRVRKHLVKIHREVYSALKQRFPDLQVGVELSFVFYDGWHDPISWTVRRAMQAFSNNYFAPRMADHTDWLGLHYFFHCRVKVLPFRNDFRKVSDLGWELYPWGVQPLMENLWRFKKPIVVEVGLADRDDIHRAWYLKECLAGVYGAIRQGVVCRAFQVWALTDNIELDKGRCFGRFGLIEVDYENDLARRIRSGAKEFAAFIRKNKE